MPRGPRDVPGGVVYHVLNRGVGRQTLFHKPADYDAFERIVREALTRVPMRILSYALMPNHWHGLLSDWPVERPEDWLGLVNQPQTETELEALRRSVTRSRPFGHPMSSDN